MDNAKFPEGSHLLTLIVGDKSGKEASCMYNFIKDIRPPEISINKIGVVDDKNTSKVDNGVSNNWWTKTSTERLNLLLAAPLKDGICTVSYDPGPDSKPALSGSFSDTVSNIDAGSFIYWIDSLPAGAGRTAADMDGSGMNWRWTIDLVKANGDPLPDGVHTIIIEVADSSGNKNADRIMIAFRIDSKPPLAAITVPANKVFGNAARQGDPVFTITGTASDANLKNIVLQIKDPAGANINGANGVEIGISNAAYTPLDPASYSAEDKVALTWSYPVGNSVFAGLIDGYSYEVNVIAYDEAGNASEKDVWTFTVDKKPPEFEFNFPTRTNPAAGLTPQNFIDVSNPVLDGVGEINRVTGQTLRIQGKVKDATSAVRKLQSRLEKWNWSTGAWEQIDDWEPVVKVPAGAPAGTDDGLYANKSKEITWTKDYGENYPEGLYRLKLRARDESYTQQGSDTGWASNDRGNPAESPYLYFYYDRANPFLTVDGSMDAPETNRIRSRDQTRAGRLTTGVIPRSRRICISTTTAPIPS